MTKKNRIKKALPLLGLATCAGVTGIVSAITIDQLKNTKRIINNLDANEATLRTDLVPGKHVSIDGWFSGSVEELSTINGQEIVDAINSFEEGSYNINNQNNAYNFTFYSGEDAYTSLMRQIQENIKYLKNNDYSRVYDIPQEYIKITKTNNFNLFNILIDVSKLNGKIVYFKNYNPSINLSPIEGATPMGRQEVTWIQFNAISYTNSEMPILENAKEVKTINIVYIILACVSSLLVILLLALWIKKRNANKYIY